MPWLMAGANDRQPWLVHVDRQEWVAGEIARLVSQGCYAITVEEWVANGNAFWPPSTQRGRLDHLLTDSGRPEL